MGTFMIEEIENEDDLRSERMTMMRKKQMELRRIETELKILRDRCELVSEKLEKIDLEEFEDDSLQN